MSGYEGYGYGYGGRRPAKGCGYGGYPPYSKRPVDKEIVATGAAVTDSQTNTLLYTAKSAGTYSCNGQYIFDGGNTSGVGVWCIVHLAQGQPVSTISLSGETYAPSRDVLFIGVIGSNTDWTNAMNFKTMKRRVMEGDTIRLLTRASASSIGTLQMVVNSFLKE